MAPIPSEPSNLTAPLPRVVLVGFNKCATRSLGRLFERAGHRVVHHKIRRPFRISRVAARIIRNNISNGRRTLLGIEDYTFYCDLIDVTPNSYYEGNSAFREILRDYPDTILLLNVRDREDWIRSRMKHGHGEFSRRCMQALGISNREELAQKWRNSWDSHIADVRGYMADRPAQFVEFNIDRDNAADLCSRLSAYRLDPADWIDSGRSRGRRLGWLTTWAKRYWAHVRFRF